ncbi:MAG: hypothetical protein HC771_18000 [Synechococcales cyanobacterium CRU_2_2]|nr:hypothetical protein [Synechococcales cyanobacterium CRU_2_2]
MSEYQVYEFQAIDRFLSSDDKAYLHSLSSRAQVGATSARFTYRFGDFRTKPEEVLDRCFDVMLYVANFGVRRLVIRLPKELVKMSKLEPYEIPYTITFEETPRSILVDLNLVCEDYYTWIEEEPMLSSLVSLREELLRGDLRLLYLAWLRSGNSEESPLSPDAMLEPPVPAGLQQLSTGLKAFAELFVVDEDLIAAAAEESAAGSEEVEEPLEKWLAELTTEEHIEYLLRAMRGETHVGQELLQRLRFEFGSEADEEEELEGLPGRSLGDLMAIAQQKQQQRKQQAAQAEQQAREQYLDALVPKQEALWQEVTRLIELKTARGYEQSVAILVDLKAVALLQGKVVDFMERVQVLVDRYSGRSALKKRMKDANLLD